MTTRRAISPTIWRKCTRRTLAADLALDGDVAALVEVGALVRVGGEPLPGALDDLGDAAAVRARG